MQYAVSLPAVGSLPVGYKRQNSSYSEPFTSMDTRETEHLTLQVISRASPGELRKKGPQ